MCLHRGNDFLALALSENSLIIADIGGMRVVRRINNAHSGAVNDMVFTQDAHWLITASEDLTVKVCL